MLASEHTAQRIPALHFPVLSASTFFSAGDVWPLHTFSVAFFEDEVLVHALWRAEQEAAYVRQMKRSEVGRIAFSMSLSNWEVVFRLRVRVVLSKKCA